MIKPQDQERRRILLHRSCLDDGVRPRSDDSSHTEVAPINPSLGIIDRVLQANRDHESLESRRQQAQAGHENRTMDNDLLLFDGRLVVPNDTDLRARLLDEIHRQPSTAHPGIAKTRKLVAARYCWPTWRKDVHDYVDNCYVCKRTA